MQEPHTDLAIGDTVEVRGAVWRVTDVRRFETCARIDLAASEGGHETSCALLYPFDRPRRAGPAQPRVASARSLAQVLVQAAWTAHPFGVLRAAAAAQIDLHPYQLEPALAVVRGMATRVLLADEVGLGKTIQAGAILSELAALGLARRALVLAPAGLRDQWVGELDRRFRMQATVVDAAHLLRAAGLALRGVNPWALDGVFVSSYDFAKRPEVLRALDPLTWDAVVVDEAHAVSGASDRHLAVDGLCRRARLVLLLTATPHAGVDAGFARLCAIGRHAGGDDDRLLVFRRTRSDVGLARTRRVRLLRVTLTGSEHRMHRLLERYSREVWREASAGVEARLAMIVLRKRALSCAVSLLLSLERRQRLLRDGAPVRERQLPLPIEDDVDPRDEADDDILAAPGLANQARERAWLGALVAAARAAAAHERKLAALVRLLRRTREPAIVFTEYRDTLEAIAGAISGAATTARLHGGMTRRERTATLASFDAGDARVLVATDTAGEGLNLQARCRWVIDFELPWTPARLEQRIGRVDRLGQARPVHAVHLIARDTAESLVVARLVGRARRARTVLGRGGAESFPEEAIAAVVMGSPSAARAVVDVRRRSGGHTAAGAVVRPPRGLRAAARAEAERLARLRGLVRLVQPGESGQRMPAGGGPLAGVLRRRARYPACAPGAILLYRAAIVDAAGRPADTSLVTVLVAGGPPPARSSARAVRGWVTGALERVGRDASREASRVARARLALVARRRRDAAARPLARERTLAEAMRAALARPLVQPGLFDRRAIRRAERDRRAARAHDADAGARVRHLEAGCRLAVAPAELLLVIACRDVHRFVTAKAGGAS